VQSSAVENDNNVYVMTKYSQSTVHIAYK